MTNSAWTLACTLVLWIYFVKSEDANNQSCLPTHLFSQLENCLLKENELFHVEKEKIIENPIIFDFGKMIELQCSFEDKKLECITKSEVIIKNCFRLKDEDVASLHLTDERKRSFLCDDNAKNLTDIFKSYSRIVCFESLEKCDMELRVPPITEGDFITPFIQNTICNIIGKRWACRFVKTSKCIGNKVKHMFNEKRIAVLAVVPECHALFTNEFPSLISPNPYSENLAEFVPTSGNLEALTAAVVKTDNIDLLYCVIVINRLIMKQIL